MKISRMLAQMVVTIAAVGGGTSAVSQQPPAQAKQSEGQTMAQEQPQANASLGATEAQLRNELKSIPQSVSTLYGLALVLRQENKPRESLETYTQAAKLQKPDAEQLRSVALDYVLLGDYDDAIRWLKVAFSLDPKDAEVLYSLGRCLYTQGRFHEAEASYLQVLQIDAAHRKAQENLGLTYQAENEPQKAEQVLRTAAASADKEPSPDEWPFLDLGVFLLDQGRAGDALPFLRKAAAIAPQSAICHERLGRALISAGSTADGIKELQVAVKLDPKNPKTHFELGHAYREAGQQNEAIAEFERSKALYGNHQQD